MTPEAKSALARTIRGGSDGGLRQHLIERLHAATESAWRLGVRVQDAGLDAAQTVARRRFEQWIGDQVRAQGGKAKRTAADFRHEAELQAAYTWLNRIVILRLMEAQGLRREKVVTGGWQAPGYQVFRSVAPALLKTDDCEGYRLLLQLVFDELALELPGLFGPAGVADLVPMPASVLRHLVEQLDDPALATCWTDDMTLGWIYQYWNDPAREALDAKLNSGGKVEPHEIASKTQMFTERYMVDWLLQNSLGPMWLAICAQNGWTPEVQADGTLDRLEARRVEWRQWREDGQAVATFYEEVVEPAKEAKRALTAEEQAEKDRLDGLKTVSLTDLMPLESDAERRWAYYVPQPLPQDAIDTASASIRDLKMIDPAVGSGHFLVVAFDLLVAMHREEARHRGEQHGERWSDAAIVERIFEHTLHGIDLDPRAVQIAAAALWLKSKAVSADARPKRMNLVAANLGLTRLAADDPAIVRLKDAIAREVGVPEAFTDELLAALKGADHLGSLLKIDGTIDAKLGELDGQLGWRKPAQGDLFGGTFPEQQIKLGLTAAEAKAGLIERLEGFLAAQTHGDDLGLRLHGAQLAAGVRFVRLVREGVYDLVVANPPYQGTSKMADAKYVAKHYPLGKADLYAAFLLRGLELAREGGVSAMLTMRNWMFIKQYAGLRAHLLGTFDLRALGDFDRGAFEDVPDEVVSVAVSILCRAQTDMPSLAVCPTPREDTSRDSERTLRKRAGTRCQLGRVDFSPRLLKIVPEWPVVYWWSSELALYDSSVLLGDTAPLKLGVQTSNALRFNRLPMETAPQAYSRSGKPGQQAVWVPYIKGAAGQVWVEPLRCLLKWEANGLELKVQKEAQYGSYARHIQSEAYFFHHGVACSPIGSAFSARAHRYPSIIDNMGLSVFTNNVAKYVSVLNTTLARRILASLNPTVHFTSGDVNRLPVAEVPGYNSIYSCLGQAIASHESHREPSVEFTHPGPSPWTSAQAWAQRAVDRPADAPLPPYDEVLDPEPPTDHVSFALGVALGRFGAAGEGILDPATADLSAALPHGVCFLDGSLPPDDPRDSLGHPACAQLHAAWTAHGAAIDPKRSLRDWLRLKFFGDVHRQMYENRPIHWPLSSAKKTFVAWVTIHRMGADTLRVLLADHLNPALTRLDGQLDDLRVARDGADGKAARAAEKQLAKVQGARQELIDFIADVTECAEHGPPPTDPRKCPAREQDARYDPDLDDGVMINSAALWPLLVPQWKDPKKWWKELATAKGRKDYDWSHLAMRYWPTRVDEKCQDDPSLGVAHGCFWAYHPARAWAWELRLQDEIGPEFRIEEADYRGLGDDVALRAAYLAAEPDEALAAVEKEALRRRGRGKDAVIVESMTLLEPGLWSARPAVCRAIEAKISAKQEAAFVLHAPDAPEREAVLTQQALPGGEG